MHKDMHDINVTDRLLVKKDPKKVCSTRNIVPTGRSVTRQDVIEFVDKMKKGTEKKLEVKPLEEQPQDLQPVKRGRKGK